MALKVRLCACGSEADLGAKYCPECCEAEGHALYPHQHPMVPVVSEPGKPPPKVRARSRPCEGRFWCQSCRSWLKGPACPPVTVAA